MRTKPYFLSVAGLLALAMWIWVQDVAIAHQQVEAAELGIPRGNLSDLYPRWMGARELLLHGRDPYRDDITREIQTGYYGRPIDPARPHDPRDQQAFAYPLYVVFVLAPLVRAPFHAVQHEFLWLLITLTAASVLLWHRALRWNVSISAKVTAIILVLGCFPVIQGFKLQQLTLLVSVLIAAALYAVTRRYFMVAGILLAVASIKPQLVFLLVLWLGTWVVGNWRERQRLFWSFVSSMVALVLGAELLLPGWIGEFRKASAAYYQYTGGGRSVLDVMLTAPFGRALSAVFVLVLLLLLWKVRWSSAESAEFHWSMALVMATTLVVIPMFAPYNQVLLIPVLMVVVRSVHELWAGSSLRKFLVSVATLSVFWPWIAAAALAISLLFFPVAQVQKAWAAPLYTSLAIPVLVLALVLAGRVVFCKGSEPTFRDNTTTSMGK